MSIIFRLHCPICKSRKINTVFEAKTPDDYVGAPCAVCGYIFTEEEIQGQVDATIGKAFDDRMSK